MARGVHKAARLAYTGHMDDDSLSPREFALLAAAFEGGLVVLAVGLGWLSGQTPLETFHWSISDVGKAAVATVPPLGLLCLCMVCPLRPFRNLARAVDELLVPMFKGLRLLDLAVISILAGLGEEMLFRGVIQQAIMDWIGTQLGMWIALVVTAVLFGLAHRITNTYAVLAGFIGFFLGWIWLASGNLLVPIIVHAAYDFLALVYLVKFRRQPLTTDN